MHQRRAAAEGMRRKALLHGEIAPGRRVQIEFAVAVAEGDMVAAPQRGSRRCAGQRIGPPVHLGIHLGHQDPGVDAVGADVDRHPAFAGLPPGDVGGNGAEARARRGNRGRGWRRSRPRSAARCERFRRPLPSTRSSCACASAAFPRDKQAMRDHLSADLARRDRGLPARARAAAALPAGRRAARPARARQGGRRDGEGGRGALAGVVGLAVAPHGRRRRERIALVSGHPVPTRRSVAAAERLLALARDAGEDDLVLVLLSGGASALACLPGDGLTLAEKRRLPPPCSRRARRSEINCVRRHISRASRAAARLRGAGAAADPGHLRRGRRLARGYRLGPDRGRPYVGDAQAILDRYGIAAPSAAGPRPPGRCRATGAWSPSAAAARRRGGRGARGSATRSGMLECEGEARDVGREHAALALQRSRARLISGGELTVTVRGPGGAGPNQEYALAAAPGSRGPARHPGPRRRHRRARRRRRGGRRLLRRRRRRAARRRWRRTTAAPGSPPRRPVRAPARPDTNVSDLRILSWCRHQFQGAGPSVGTGAVSRSWAMDDRSSAAPASTRWRRWRRRSGSRSTRPGGRRRTTCWSAGFHGVKFVFLPRHGRGHRIPPTRSTPAPMSTP